MTTKHKKIFFKSQKIPCIFGNLWYSYNMNITKEELRDSLVNARAALALQVRDHYKHRNGFCGKSFRGMIRENLRALRLLGNLETIDAKVYTFDARILGRVKKALAK